MSGGFFIWETFEKAFIKRAFSQKFLEYEKKSTAHVAGFFRFISLYRPEVARAWPAARRTITQIIFDK